MKVYLDNAATTPMDPKIIEMTSKMMSSHFGIPSQNISSLYGTSVKGRWVLIILDKYTEDTGRLINFSLEFCLQGIPMINSDFDTIVDAQDNCPLLNNEDQADIDENGIGDVCDHLKQLLEMNARTFVSIMHANNEIGVIQDIKSIGDLCLDYNAIFHSDTVQTIGHYTFNMQQINVDFMAASAHKFHGPKGIGFIYISENIKIKPILRGGAQERNMRAGTENIYGIAGLALAMKMSYSNLEEERKYIEEIKLYMIEKLKSEIADVQFYGNCTDMENSLYTVLSCHFPETDIE